MPAVTKRLGVRYSGSVQGVGFRATARSIARGFDVSGWVRNEPDGTVWLEAQGEADEVDRFLGRLRERMEELIDNADARELSPVEAHRAFEIRR